MAEIEYGAIDENAVRNIDPFNKPIPGQSLTNDPDEAYPWERSPEHTTVKAALDDLVTNIFEEERLVAIVELLARRTLPIASIAQILLEQGFRQGKWNPDLMLLLAEPLMVILMALAERAEIRDYEIYEGEFSEMAEEDKLSISKEAHKELSNAVVFGMKMPPIKKESVPEEILETIDKTEIPKPSLMERQ